MATYIKALGDTATRQNEIQPAFDAMIFNYLTGHDAGVIRNQLGNFNVTAVDRGIVISAGLAQAYGFFGMSDEAVRVNFVMPSTTNYLYVYLEFDLTNIPNAFHVKTTPISNSNAHSFRQDDLKDNPYGKYEMPLYMVTLTSTTVTLSDKRILLTKPADAVHSDTADNSLAFAGIKINRAGTKLSISDAETDSEVGKLVCVPQGVKLETKTPLLDSAYFFQKGRMSLTIPNWSADKIYEWVHYLNGVRASGEVVRFRGSEVVLRGSASGNPVSVLVTGGGTFTDGLCWDKSGGNADFGGNDWTIQQIYEIQEVQ